MSAPPIACTLSADAFKERMSAIGELNRDALRGHERHDLTLVLSYAPEAAARVRAMVRAEQECCAFLHFEVSETSDSVRVSITAPEEARVSAETLLEDFVTGAQTAPACACC